MESFNARLEKRIIEMRNLHIPNINCKVTDCHLEATCNKVALCQQHEMIICHHSNCLLEIQYSVYLLEQGPVDMCIQHECAKRTRQENIPLNQ